MRRQKIVYGKNLADFEAEKAVINNLNPKNSSE